jgi:hypothetical protein
MAAKGEFNNFSDIAFPLERTGHRAREQRCPAFCSPCLPQNNFEISVMCQRAYIELFVRSVVVVVVVVVSAELAHPEIKTAVSASAVKAISLVIIAVTSELARNADGSRLL